MEQKGDAEFVMINCCFCNKPIETKWVAGGGLVPGDYVLLGDFISHVECFYDISAEPHDEKGGLDITI